MIVEHYKGGRYTVLCYGDVFNSTNSADREEMVLYVSHTTGGVFVRTKSEFDEPVTWPDGIVRPRFLSCGRYRRPEKTGQRGGP